MVGNAELRRRARARRVTHRPSASLKGSRKIQIQFWELHVGFYSVDNGELPARAQVTRPPPASLKGSRKIEIQFWELHVDFYIVNTAELPARARARVTRRPSAPLNGS